MVPHFGLEKCDCPLYTVFQTTFHDNFEDLDCKVRSVATVLSYSPPPLCAAEATGLGFVCFGVINPCVLSTNRVDLGFLLLHKSSNFTPPSPLMFKSLLCSSFYILGVFFFFFSHTLSALQHDAILQHGE